VRLAGVLSGGEVTLYADGACIAVSSGIGPLSAEHDKQALSVSCRHPESWHNPCVEAPSKAKIAGFAGLDIAFL
jgi:hypothetical protein